jgi:hypothetical protein
MPSCSSKRRQNWPNPALAAEALSLLRHESTQAATLRRAPANLREALSE